MGLSSSKTKTKSEPWAPAQPYILKGMQQVSDVFDQNQQRLQDMSKVAQDGYMKIAGDAFEAPNPYVANAQAAAQRISNGSFLDNNPGQSTYDRLQGTRPGPWPTGHQRAGGDPSMAMLMGMARDRSTSPGNAALSALAQAGQNPADGFASGVAGGQYLNGQPSAGLYSNMMGEGYLNGNPYLDGMIETMKGNVTKDTNRLFAQRGMGSGVGSAFGDLLSKNLASAEGQMRYQNYNDAANRQLQAAGQSDAVWGGERGRMDNATGLLASNHNAGMDRMLSAANALNQADQQSRAQQLAAAQALGGQYSSAQDRSLDAAKASDAARSDQVNQMLQALAMTGELREAQYAGISPAIALLNAAADTPYVGTAALNGQIRDASNGYGTTTTKTGMNLYQTWLENASRAAAAG